MNGPITYTLGYLYESKYSKPSMVDGVQVLIIWRMGKSRG